MTVIMSKKLAMNFLLMFQLTTIGFAPVPVLSGVSVTKSFMKVELRTFFKSCLLKSHASVYDTGALTLEECAGKCIQASTCMLFCFNEGDKLCITSSVFSSNWFPGIPENSTSETVTYDVCYSSWASQYNIVRDTMATSSSDPFDTHLTKELAIDGYYCHAGNDDDRRFIALRQVNNYLQLDLGAIVSVREIRIAVSQKTQPFDTVTVRFGPSATSTSNDIIAEFAGPGPTGDLRIYLDPPVEGRYLHFQQAANFYFSIGELQVIPDD